MDVKATRRRLFASNFHSQLPLDDCRFRMDRDLSGLDCMGAETSMGMEFIALLRFSKCFCMEASRGLPRRVWFQSRWAPASESHRFVGSHCRTRRYRYAPGNFLG